MRIAQWDILEFSRNSKHVSPEWPAGYWPPTEAPPGKAAWGQSVRAFQADLKAMQKLVADRACDLLAPIPHGAGQTLLREALLLPITMRTTSPIWLCCGGYSDLASGS